MKVEVIATFSTIDEKGREEFICTVQVINDWINKYRKDKKGNIINVYDENDYNYNCFTHSNLNTLKEFKRACIEHAQQELNEMLNN